MSNERFFFVALCVSVFNGATFTSVTEIAHWNQCCPELRYPKAGLPSPSQTCESSMKCSSQLLLRLCLPIKDLRLKGGSSENCGNVSIHRNKDTEGNPAARAVENIERIRRSGRRLTIEDVNDAIRECWRGGRWDLSLDIYGLLAKECLKPNRVTFNAVLGACARGGQHDMAEKIFSDMSAHNINADDITYNAMIISFAR
jgi:pentatricopeptide repeat protein